MKSPGGITKFLEKWHLLLLLFGAFIFRILIFVPGFMEMDSFSYLKMSGALREAITTGNLSAFLVQPDGGFLLWPPLYSILAAVFPSPPDITPALVSILAGTLLILPVYFIANSLWGKNAAILAGILTALAPMLSYYSGIGRTESLYMLLLFLGIWQMIRLLHDGKTYAGLWAGLFFGLAYLTRFEGGLAAALAGLMIIFSILFSAGKKQRALSVILLVLGFLIVSIPYWAYLNKQFGGFHVTPPSISLYNDLELQWRLEKPASHFVYEFGIPGENSPEDLKDLAASHNMKPGGLGIWKITGAYFKFLPSVILSILANFSPFILICLFFVVPIYLKNSGAKFLAWFSILALPLSLLTFWDSNPRYYAFLIPIGLILISPWLMDILKKPDGVPQKLLIFLGAGLSLTWMFPLSDHLYPAYLNLVPIMKTIPNLFFVSLLLLLIGAAILGLVYWKFNARIAFIIGAGGLMLIFVAAMVFYYTSGSLIGGRPVQASASDALGMALYAGFRSLILWIFLCAFLWEYIYRAEASSSGKPHTRRGMVVFLAVIFMLLCFQNLFVIRDVMERHRFLTSFPELRSEIKKLGGGDSIYLAAKYPWNAYQAGASWNKIPPDADFEKFRQSLFFENPDYILDVSYKAETLDYPYYSAHMNRLSGDNDVEVVSILRKESKSRIDGPLVVKLYKFRKSAGN